MFTNIKSAGTSNNKTENVLTSDTKAVDVKVERESGDEERQSEIDIYTDHVIKVEMAVGHEVLQHAVYNSNCSKVAMPVGISSSSSDGTHPASQANTSELSQNYSSNNRNGSIIKLEAMSAVKEEQTEELYAEHKIKDEMVIESVVLQAVTYMMEENGERLPEKPRLDTQDKTTEPGNIAKETRTETITEEIISNDNTESSDTKPLENIKNKIPTKTSKPRNNTQKNIRNDKNNKTTKNVFQCNVKQYDKKPDLAQHIESYDKTKRDIYFKCKECTYQSVTQCSLERHLKLHDKSRRFVCDVCGYRYPRNAYLQEHLRSVHSDEKLHECDICDYKTNNIRNLNTHLRIHSGEKPYSCSECQYKCNNKSHLKRHSRIHTGEKPYSCSECNYKCTQSSKLKQHLRTHITGTRAASRAHTAEPSQNHNSNDRNGSIIKLETEAMSAVREEPTEELYADHEIKDEMVIGPVVLQAFPCMMEENAEPLPKKPRLDTQDKNKEPDNTAKQTRAETNTEEFTPKDCSENTDFSDIPTKTSKPRNNTQKNIRNDENNKRTKNIFQCNVNQYDKQPDLAQHIESHDKTKRGIYFKCKECRYQSVTQCSLERHLKLHDKSRRFVCDVCGYRYMDNAHLQEHLRNVHADEKTHECGICSYKTNNIPNLNRHLRMHSGEKPYSCSLCEYKCSDKSHLKSHSLIHTAEKPHSCSECNYKCKRSSHLKQHLRTHKTYPASHANTSEPSQNHNSNDRNGSIIKLETEAMSAVREEPTEELYAEHEIKDEMVIGPVVLQAVTYMMEENAEPLPEKPRLDTQDKTTEPYNTAKQTRTETNTEEITPNGNTESSDTEPIENVKNKISTKTSKPRNNTQKYIRNDKNNKTTKNVFQCNVKQYDKIPDLVQHIESHDKTKRDIYFKCKECTYQSVTQCSLERHLKLHDKSRRFVCDVCGYRYMDNKQLQEHLRYVHSDKKIHECGICDYKTNIIRNLNTHLRTHTGEKPYSCSECEYKCNHKSSLKRHSLIHTGEKPYSCSLCEFKCNQKSDLKTHSRIHTGEKPYSCSECNYKCTRSGSLKQHWRAHSK